VSPLARIRLRRGSSITEVLVAGGILAAGMLPLFGYWVKLARDTGGVTSRARAFRAVRETMDRYQAMGPARLQKIAGPDGELADEEPSRGGGTSSGAHLMSDAIGGRDAGGIAAVRPAGGAAFAVAPVAAALAATSARTGPSCAVRARITRERALLRLRVESQVFPGIKVERLMPLPVEPAAPAWQ
jgi:hypothetical protein